MTPYQIPLRDVAPVQGVYTDRSVCQCSKPPCLWSPPQLSCWPAGDPEGGSYRVLHGVRAKVTQFDASDDPVQAVAFLLSSSGGDFLESPCTWPQLLFLNRRMLTETKTVIYDSLPLSGRVGSGRVGSGQVGPGRVRSGQSGGSRSEVFGNIVENSSRKLK